tara:strand:- start:48 stop:233 length:186 start_codon:yes stop_codon:yes gene_type:complete
MSKHIVKMYNKLDADIKKSPTSKATKNSGLIPQRKEPEEESNILHYVKQIRKMRESNNGTK